MREAEQARAAETEGEDEEILQPSRDRQMDCGCCGVGVWRQAAGPAALLPAPLPKGHSGPRAVLLVAGTQSQVLCAGVVARSLQLGVLVPEGLGNELHILGV